MKIQLVFGLVLIAAYANAASVSSTTPKTVESCKINGATVKVGEWKPSPVGTCQQMTCQQNGDIGAVGCPLAHVAKNCKETPGDKTKVFPDCCPGVKC